MNKLLTYAGTMPVYLGDIDFMQDAAGSAINQLVRALMDSGDGSLNAILQGVEISRPDTHVFAWTAGVVVINGEILPIEAGSVSTLSLGNLYFHVNSTLSGDRTFKDGQTHQCHDTRSAVINTTSSGGIAVSSVPRLHEEVVVDDHVYAAASVSGAIGPSKLIRKSGLWFVDLSISLGSTGVETIGSAVFSNLSDVNYGEMEETSFYDTLLIRGVGVTGNEPFRCEIVKSSSNNTVTLQLDFLAASQVAGGAKYQALIPVW